MSLKGMKLDTNGFQMAIKKNVIVQQLGAPNLNPVCDRRVARNLHWGGGGLLWRLEATSNELDPDFDWSAFRLSRHFCRNLGDLQQKKKVFTVIETVFLSKSWRSPNKKKKQKKRLHSGWNPVFVVNITSGFWAILNANTIRGATFVFSAKIRLKSTKNRVFCVLFRSMGKSRPPPSPPTPLNTLLWCDVNELRPFG